MSVERIGKWVGARFVARPSRFIVRAALRDGTEVEAHLADPGRLRELLLPGATLRLAPVAPHALRRTRYSVKLVRSAGPTRAWVSLDTTAANRLAEGLLADGSIHGLRGGFRVRREVRHERSRFDFLLTRPGSRRVWVEVKSVTCADAGTGRFPDAPTSRGRRHVEALTSLVHAGDRAAILFVVQRDDVRVVRPYTEIDPEFTRALRDARTAGVLLRAARFRIDSSGRARHLGPLPVRIPSASLS